MGAVGMISILQRLTRALRRLEKRSDLEAAEKEMAARLKRIQS